MKTIHGEYQHALVVADVDKIKIRNLMRKTSIERRKISLQKDEIRKQAKKEI